MKVCFGGWKLRGDQSAFQCFEDNGGDYIEPMFTETIEVSDESKVDDAFDDFLDRHIDDKCDEGERFVFGIIGQEKE